MSKAYSSAMSAIEAISASKFADDAERFQVKEALRKLVVGLETPFERVWSLSFENAPLIAGLRILIDLGHIAALYMLEETRLDTWKPTAFSLGLGDDSGHISAGVVCGDDHTILCALNMPKFLAKYGYLEPVDMSKLDNYTDWTGGTSFFEACAADPEGKGGSFIGMMTALRNHKLDWTEVYDTNKIAKGADISGGTPLFRMAYDFFTPQPEVGSHAYFFHAVPHDWPDADCVRMFEQVKKVFNKGYSKLLIYEVVLPSMGATNMQTMLDLEIMNCTSGVERTEAHWVSLLQQVGFRIVEISRHPRAVESVIEADLE
ncbi:hypothetical protein FB567DRAFT_571493 [Paraphoma chrysanthemicola]|uniref:O-methyltransferase C-terminal domain-containing protein n=1 Tax=Paraphoma chrysanthemicola TaxID=798071 RepID=A0A8K0R0U3_9PLEO|nr:hypothetical protein FB567DRAFT_571493 [Paraphoma chrysanthemicola]